MDWVAEVGTLEATPLPYPYVILYARVGPPKNLHAKMMSHRLPAQRVPLNISIARYNPEECDLGILVRITTCLPYSDTVLQCNWPGIYHEATASVVYKNACNK